MTVLSSWVWCSTPIPLWRWVGFFGRRVCHKLCVGRHMYTLAVSLAWPSSSRIGRIGQARGTITKTSLFPQTSHCGTRPHDPPNVSTVHIMSRHSRLKMGEVGSEKAEWTLKSRIRRGVFSWPICLYQDKVEFRKEERVWVKKWRHEVNTLFEPNAPHKESSSCDLFWVSRTT